MRSGTRMFDNVGPKERFAYAILVAALLSLAGYVGAQYLRKPAGIVFEDGKAPVASPGADSALKAAPDSEVVVHVAGRVKKGGVYRLGSNARVEDALAKAGGAEADADLDRLNLAARLVDGTQVYVPRKGETSEVVPEPAVDETYSSRPTSKPQVASSNEGRRSGPKPTPAAGSISLNGASMAQLQTLPGVGPATAEKILEYRKSHGRFTAVDELLAVKGIGPKKLERMRRYLRL